MLYLACYDIDDNRLRTKVANSLLAYGLERLQLSVFVGSLSDSLQQAVVDEVSALLQLSDPATARFLLMPLAEAYSRRSFWLGDQPPNWSYHCNRVQTLIL